MYLPDNGGTNIGILRRCNQKNRLKIFIQMFINLGNTVLVLKIGGVSEPPKQVIGIVLFGKRGGKFVICDHIYIRIVLERAANMLHHLAQVKISGFIRIMPDCDNNLIKNRQTA